MEAYSSVGRSSGFTEETLNLSMCEELVDDWVTFTAPKRGPLLKSRLIGDAHTYKAVSRITFCKVLKKESTISRTR